MLTALVDGPAYVDGRAADVYSWGMMLREGAPHPLCPCQAHASLALDMSLRLRCCDAAALVGVMLEVCAACAARFCWEQLSQWAWAEAG